MNNHLAVLTDTNSGFSAEAASVYGIEMVPMPVILDGETYYEHQTITQEDFFLRLKHGASVKHPSPHLMYCWRRGNDCSRTTSR
jgi:fatty acid-binding protein DegV